MIGFDYAYKNSFEIFQSITKITEYNLSQYILLIIGVICIILLVFFIIPYINVILVTRAQENKKKQKKDLMNKIILQKNLEDIITREIQQKTGGKELTQ